MNNIIIILIPGLVSSNQTINHSNLFLVHNSPFLFPHLSIILLAKQKTKKTI